MYKGSYTRRQAKKIEKIYQSFAGRLSLSHFRSLFSSAQSKRTWEWNKMLRYDVCANVLVLTHSVNGTSRWARARWLTRRRNAQCKNNNIEKHRKQKNSTKPNQTTSVLEQRVVCRVLYCTAQYESEFNNENERTNKRMNTRDERNKKKTHQKPREENKNTNTSESMLMLLLA